MVLTCHALRVGGQRVENAESCEVVMHSDRAGGRQAHPRHRQAVRALLIGRNDGAVRLVGL